MSRIAAQSASVSVVFIAHRPWCRLQERRFAQPEPPTRRRSVRCGYSGPRAMKPAFRTKSQQRRLVGPAARSSPRSGPAVPSPPSPGREAGCSAGNATALVSASSMTCTRGRSGESTAEPSFSSALLAVGVLAGRACVSTMALSIRSPSSASCSGGIRSRVDDAKVGQPRRHQQHQRQHRQDPAPSGAARRRRRSCSVGLRPADGGDGRHHVPVADAQRLAVAHGVDGGAGRVRLVRARGCRRAPSGRAGGPSGR